jgi:hypothetical protein
MNYFNITNNKIKTSKTIQYLLDKINLLRRCVTQKDWYIHVVMLYTQHDQKCKLVAKESANVYFMCQTFIY